MWGAGGLWLSVLLAAASVCADNPDAETCPGGEGECAGAAGGDQTALLQTVPKAHQLLESQQLDEDGCPGGRRRRRRRRCDDDDDDDGEHGDLFFGDVRYSSEVDPDDEGVFGDAREEDSDDSEENVQLVTGASMCSKAGVDPKNFQSGVPMGSSGLFVPAYSSQPLRLDSGEPLEKIKRAVIYGHGAGGNANDYFCVGMMVADKFGAAESTLTIATWFGKDQVIGSSWSKDVDADSKSVHWTSLRWLSGGDSNSVDGKVFSSFEALDQVVTALNGAVKSGRLPNLEQITFAGFSAGCQLGSRWAVLSNKTSLKRVQVIVSDCGSYMYLDEMRPSKSCRFRESRVPPECKQFNKPNKTLEDYNSFKYGLMFDPQKKSGFTRLAPLMTDKSALQDVVGKLPQKRLKFIFGTQDICNCAAQNYNNSLESCFPGGTNCKPNPQGYENNGVMCCDTYPDAGSSNVLDWSVPSIYQGSNRLQRGLYYVQHLSLHFESQGTRYVPPWGTFEGGHDALAAFTSAKFKAWVFGS